MMVIALCALIIDNTQAFLGSSANAIESLIYEIDAIKLKLFNKTKTGLSRLKKFNFL